MLIFYNWVLICVLALIAGLSELMFNSLGLFVPVFVVAAFYLFIANAWWRVFLPVTVMGVLLDAARGRVLVLNILALVLAYFIARHWFHYGTRRRYLPQFFPGAVLGAAAWILSQFSEAITQGGWLAVFSPGSFLTGTFSAVLLGGVAAIVFAVFADAFARRCEMPTFIKEIQ
jgi:hypothetical protein